MFSEVNIAPHVSTGRVRAAEPPTFSRRWPPPNLRTAPFTFLTTLDVRQPVVFERQYGNSTEVETVAARPKTIMRVNSPLTFVGHGKTMVRMASPLLDGHPGETRSPIWGPPTRTGRTKHCESRQPASASTAGSSHFPLCARSPNCS